jgi:hypothetical protein
MLFLNCLVVSGGFLLSQRQRVRKARAAGVDCAQWGGTETILATAIDGAATQGFVWVSPARHDD